MEVRGRILGTRTHPRGVYLVSTLLLLTTLVIMSGAVIVSFSQSLTMSGGVANRQLASQAALCGLTFLQARLESSASLYSPTSPCNETLTTTDSSLQVQSRNSCVVGYLNNRCVSLGEEGRIHLLFRVAFNSASDRFAPPAELATLNDVRFDVPGYGQLRWRLPDLAYLSMNNLGSSAEQSAGLYAATGRSLHAVQGGTADVVVEGLAVSSGGTVLARSWVESVLTSTQVGRLGAAVSTAKNLRLEVLQSGGPVSVTSSSNTVGSLAALRGDIQLVGRDASTPSGGPPNYTASSRASVGSGSSLTYTHETTTSDFTSGYAQTKTVTPPAIPVSQLPALQGGAVSVQAGLWVVWNGELYHYPTTYEALDVSGNPIPLNRAPWTQPDPNRPPLYNGVAPDTDQGASTLGSGGTLALNAATNTISVDRDVTVQGSAGLAIVVAPATVTTATGTVSIRSPQVDSSAVGSAQVVLQGDTTPQVRAAGDITVIGNVVGKGSLVSAGQTSSIHVVGRSALDSRSDRGVALYATGDLNFMQLSYAQAPAAVPAVSTAFTSAGITPGSGAASGGAGSAAGALSARALAVRQAVMQAVRQESSAYIGAVRNVDGGFRFQRDNLSGIGEDIDYRTVSVSLEGHSYSGQLHEVIRSLTGQDGVARATVRQQIGNVLVGSGTVQMGEETIPAMRGTAPDAWQTIAADYFVADEHISSYVASGLAVDESAVPSPSASASPSPSASPASGGSGAGTSSAALNQAFQGLVYAGRNIRFSNDLGSVSVNGAVAAFGGDPSKGEGDAGSSGGNLEVRANSISINYDPQVLGLFSSFFGGQVALRRLSTTTF